MKKYLFFVIIFLFFKIIYSQSYVECGINIPNSCFIGLYKTENSHVNLCNQTSLLYYGCQIVNGQYRIPISFSSENCGNLNVFYLYRPTNSHVGYGSAPSGTYPVCLGSYFREVLNITTTPFPNSSFLIGLYKSENSHVTINQNIPVSVRLYINITDRTNPKITLNNTEDILVLPETINIKFEDNKYLYYCQVYINGRIYGDFSQECRYKNIYEKNIIITYEECSPGLCNLNIIAVDLAGNINITNHTYKVINPCLQIEASPLSWDSIIIVDFLPYDLKIKISNPTTCYGNFVNISVNFPGIECSDIILVDGLRERTINIPSLNNGESYEFNTKIIPLKQGRCYFTIRAEGYVEGKKLYSYVKRIPLSVSIRTAVGTLIVSEPLFSLIIAILIISLILFL
ncbi:MAG: hypothetical protein QW714_02445 [Nanopusillaceae archaeon]